jgi:hypothetical protein
MSSDTIRDVRQRAEEAAYTAVGVGVLGFQQAQVRRRAAQRRLVAAARDARGQATSLTGDARAFVESVGADVKGRVEPVVTQLGDRVDPVVADLRARLEPAVTGVPDRVRRIVRTSPTAKTGPTDGSAPTT